MDKLRQKKVQKMTSENWPCGEISDHPPLNLYVPASGRPVLAYGREHADGARLPKTSAL